MGDISIKGGGKISTPAKFTQGFSLYIRPEWHISFPPIGGIFPRQKRFKVLERFLILKISPGTPKSLLKREGGLFFTDFKSHRDFPQFLKIFPVFLAFTPGFLNFWDKKFRVLFELFLICGNTRGFPGKYCVARIRAYRKGSWLKERVYFWAKKRGFFLTPRERAPLFRGYIGLGSSFF